MFHLIKGLGRGGAEVLLTEIQRCHDRSSFTHAFGFFLAHEAGLAPNLAEAKVVCFNKASAAAILMSTPVVAQFAKSWRADIIHCHLPITGAVGRFAGRWTGIPVVYTEHNVIESYHALSRTLDVATWSLQSHVVAVSWEVRKSIDRQTHSTVPVTTICNGIDTDRFRPGRTSSDARSQFEIPGDVMVVGTVANFRSEKKLDDWIAAAVLILREIPNVHFIMAGSGPTRDRVMQLAEDAGITATVRFVGVQNDVRPCLASMDVFLMSSAYEGLPLALAEAMSMKRAVVAPAVGGIPEMVTHSVNGFLVEKANPALLAAATLQLLRSPKLRSEFGDAARRTIRTRFQCRRMVERLESIYQSVVPQRSSALT